MSQAVLLAGIILQSACSSPVFYFDQAALPEVRPWTSQEFKNHEDTFQFAVIGDRTGGEREGVYGKALERLNLLQPEFVISVGDLIEGYGDNTESLTAEWDRFDGMIDELEMRFFYAVGNHDLGNDTMKQMWLERRGADYYHFVYRDVLFLVLNSEDPPNPVDEKFQKDLALYNELKASEPEKAQAMLEEYMASDQYKSAPAPNFSEQQVAYVERALARNPEVRWTFVFLHQPPWEWEKPPENFLAIERLLGDRDYTFFAGHLHYYNHEERFGRDYITMGPAGGAFQREGPGSIDHISWVTMTQDGPQIANIELGGVFTRGGREQ
jgi:hypothetical protein